MCFLGEFCEANGSNKNIVYTLEACLRLTRAVSTCVHTSTLLCRPAPVCFPRPSLLCFADRCHAAATLLCRPSIFLLSFLHSHKHVALCFCSLPVPRRCRLAVVFLGWARELKIQSFGFKVSGIGRRDRISVVICLIFVAGW